MPPLWPLSLMSGTVLTLEPQSPMNFCKWSHAEVGCTLFSVSILICYHLNNAPPALMIVELLPRLRGRQQRKSAFLHVAFTH